MNQSLPRMEDLFTGDDQPVRRANSAGDAAACGCWQFGEGHFRGAPFARPGGFHSGAPVSYGRSRNQVLLTALICALGLARPSTAGSLTERQATPPLSIPARSTAPIRVVSNTLSGPARHDSRCTLRSGKCRHVLFVVAGWDDPNDDETSDDPNDDDDAWENVTGLHETEAPITAWLPETGYYLKDAESRSEPLWSEPSLLTSFLKLQRLRC